MNLSEHIEYIRERCIDAIANGYEMRVASFDTGEGLIMTFNEAIEIVNEIDRLKAGNAELLEALKEIADPVKYMREKLSDGEKLNGVQAMHLSDSANYLKEIAKIAIKKAEEI